MIEWDECVKWNTPFTDKHFPPKFPNFPESFGKWKMPRKNSHWKKKTLEFQIFSQGEGRGESLFLSSIFGFQSSTTHVSIFQ